MTRITIAGALMIVALPLTAAAQSAPDETQPQTPQGPMIVERVHSGFMFAPEVKVTEFDKRASGLVGGSAGWVAEETFFVGGGGYWMPSRRSNDRRLAYGGFVMQWFVANGDRFGLSAKALLGGGRATLPESVIEVVGLPSRRDLDRLTPAQVNDLVRAHTITTTIGARQDFLVAEPELNARLGLTRHIRLTFGAGYRFAGNEFRRGRGFDSGNRISGAVGTLGVQIGG
jgi:hypothetical protein